MTAVDLGTYTCAKSHDILTTRKDGASRLRTIAVVGGGPAGSMTSIKLLQGAATQIFGGAARVIIFEEKPGWEKPCGGGLSY